MRPLLTLLFCLTALAGCRTSPSQSPTAPEPPPWQEVVPPPAAQYSARSGAYRRGWSELTPEQREAWRARLRERMEANPALGTQMAVVTIAVGTNGCRLLYRATVDGRAKADGSYTTKGIMYTAYGAEGRPVFRGFVPDPRHVHVEADGKIHEMELPEADLTVRVPASTVRIVLRKWERPERTGNGPPIPPSQTIIGEVDL